MRAQTRAVIPVVFWLTIATSSLAKEVLFQAEPPSYDSANGVGRKLGESLQTEFNSRMFLHRTWRQRLSYYSSQPDLNETLEIYSKPDGSRWLNHRQANPSLTGLIVRRVVHGEKFDLAKELDAIPITSRDVELPFEVANELESLWHTMLPGVTKPPEPRRLQTHIPIFDAWVRKDHTLEAGRITTAAYDTPVYRTFVELIKDLRAVCDRDAKLDDPIFKRLARKIQRLRARLSAAKD
jgi:hypothetical protein